MSLTIAGRAAAAPPVGGLVEVTVPVYNEEAILETSIARLCAYLERHLPLRWRVVIADNASTDRTWEIASRLAGGVGGVSAMRIERKGRGLALRSVWLASDADVLAYMDVDLSTNLDAFFPLVAPLLSGHSEMAIGTRLARRSTVRRQWRREVLSRGYNLLVRAMLRTRFSDAQCGFKAIRADVARLLVPRVVDDGWFFDTELLVLAERNGLRIFEVPVDWIEDLDSRVDIRRTVVDDLRGVWRLRRGRPGAGAPSPAGSGGRSRGAAG